MCVSAQSITQLYDTSNGLGSNFHELVHGVDCPWHAAYLDQAAFVDRDAPHYHPQSLCIWEQDTGIPLRRHYTQARVQPPCRCGWLVWRCWRVLHNPRPTHVHRWAECLWQGMPLTPCAGVCGQCGGVVDHALVLEDP